MKKWTALLLILGLTLGLLFLPALPEEAPASAAPALTETGEPTDPGQTTEASGRYRDGVYTASARDFRTTVTVTVTVEDDRILDIQASQEEGPSSQFQKASEKLISWILLDQQTGTDVVTGATYSSEAILSAVNDALKQAENN